MSSRALRRAQKELEERQKLEQISQAEDEEDSEDESLPAARSKPSLFTMLGEEEQDEEDEATENEEQPTVETEPLHEPAAKPKSSKKKKKKKGKAGKGAKAVKDEKDAPSTRKFQSGLDEIDQALLALNLRDTQSKADGASAESSQQITGDLQQLFSVLEVDTQHLQPANEMRKLFGRAAVEANNDPEPAGGRRRGRGHQQIGIAGAVAGRNMPGGRNLASLALRRNIFIQGKEEWPRATSGGLGMEIVEKRSDGSVEYRFVHNLAYQDVQKQFEVCVASMDPQRMIHLLQYNPYHIATLLQVSEIAKQERDHATAGDLLERALFSFGRAIHSTFSNNLAQGKARLDFRRPENREFWLAAWRYTTNLGMRATWRTAFEWAKLLLALDPDGDPYCIRLVIDQLAIRGRNPQSLVDLVNTDYLQARWKVPPNLAMSVALANNQLNSPQKARSSLSSAIRNYPWLAARLCRELEISPIPKPIWGKEPHGDYQELLCELYVKKAKDLWNTPENTSLLVEVASSLTDVGNGEDPYWLERFDDLKIARHIILLEDQGLLSFLNPSLTARYTSTSDPLPPDDNLLSYSTTRTQAADTNDPARLVEEYTTLQTFFHDLVPWLFETPEGEVPDTGERLTVEDLERRLQDSGVSLQTLRENTARLQILQNRLRNMGTGIDPGTGVVGAGNAGAAPGGWADSESDSGDEA